MFFSGYASASVAYQDERKLFKLAEKALLEKNQDLFAQLSSSLKGYPVQAYLQHDAFKARMDNASVIEVREFLQQYRQFPFHYHLLSKWLNILAERNDWDNYLAFYDGRSETKFKCLALTAKLKTGQVSNINEQIKKIWLTGYSQPKECDTAFDYFLATDSNVSESIWLRIEKAFKARRSSLVTAAMALSMLEASNGQSLRTPMYWSKERRASSSGANTNFRLVKKCLLMRYCCTAITPSVASAATR